MIDEHDDLDAPEDFEHEKEHTERPSLKEIWDNNPPLKIVAIALALVIAVGAYALFSNEAATGSKIRLSAKANQIPGTADIDPEYRRRLEEANKEDAAEKLRANGSHLDKPTEVPNNGGIKPPVMPEQPRSDVLEEWKRVADAGRMKAAKEAVDEEQAAPAPEVIPVVAPIRPQEIKPDPNASKRIVEYMKDILTHEIPPKSEHIGITTEESPYILMKKDRANEEKLAAAGNGGGTGRGGASASGNGASAKVIEAAGSIIYAQLLTTLNSDLPGPVLAQVLSGPFAGGRLIGKLSTDQACECMALEFKTVVKDTVSYKIDAVALDENTTLAGITATDVNEHYFSRYVLPAAAGFLTQYSQALSQTGETQTATSGVGTETSAPAPSPKQSVFAGVTAAAQVIGQDLSKDAAKSPTIIIAQGTTMGVFFIETATTKDATR